MEEKRKGKIKENLSKDMKDTMGKERKYEKRIQGGMLNQHC